MKESFLRSFQEISEVTDRYNPNQKASGREGWPRWPVNDMWGMAKTRRVVWFVKGDYILIGIIQDYHLPFLGGFSVNQPVDVQLLVSQVAEPLLWGQLVVQKTSTNLESAYIRRTGICITLQKWDMITYLLYNLVQDFFPSSVGVRMSRSPQLGSEMLFDEFNETKLCIPQLHYIPELLSILLCHVLSMSYSWWNLRAICRLVFLASRLWVVISVSWWTSLVAV